MTTWTCLVCGYALLSSPPVDADGDGLFEICPSCRFQFGVTDDDLGFTYDAWRKSWVEEGLPWRSEGIEPRPDGWDPQKQLDDLLRTD